MSNLESRHSKGDILIVDNTLHSLWILSGILTRSGYKVQSASDGATALLLADTPSLDLILLDVKMPGMDGFEVCRKLKSQASTRDIPVIFISAQDEAVDKVTGFKVGGVDYITKPFQLDEVLARIEMHLTLTSLQKQLERRVEERTAELAQANLDLKAEIAERVRAKKALQESEEKYRLLLENQNDLVVKFDAAGNLLFANPTYCKTFGKTEAEIIGQKFMPLLHADDPDMVVASLATLSGERHTAYHEERVTTVDGWRWFEWSAKGVFDEDGKIAEIISVGRDITARVRAEEALQKAHDELERRVADRTRELSVLYGVAALASRSLDLETTLARSLGRVLEVMGSDAGVIHLLDEVSGAASDGTWGETLRLVTQQGFPPDLVAAMESMPYNRDAGGWVLERDEALVVPHVPSDPRAIVTLALEPGMYYIGVPLRVARRTLGLLGIIRRKGQPFLGVEEVSLLTSVADQLGIVVESAWLSRRAERAAVLEERGRLARNLHDSVTQLLYSVNLFAKSGRNALDSGELDKLENCLLRLGESAQQALKEMRLLVYELRPPALEQEGLLGALQRRLDAVEERVGVASQLLVDEMTELPRQIEDELYHIAVEALNNALKHSQASSVIVRVHADRERIQLQVLDDGAGFDPRAVEGQGGLGIMGMRERAARLGAVLEITSSPGAGAQVTVSCAFSE